MENVERWTEQLEVDNNVITVNYTDLDGKWTEAILYDVKGNEIQRVVFHQWKNLKDFIFTDKGELVREGIQEYFAEN